ncbi:hypothetical protein ACLOJK_003807, partial [Asimina triloba]
SWMVFGEAYLKAEEGKKITFFLTSGRRAEPQKQVVVVVVDVDIGVCRSKNKRS